VIETFQGGSNGSLGAFGAFTTLPLDISGGFPNRLTGYTNINASGNTGTVSGGIFSLNGGTQWYRWNNPLPSLDYQVELQLNAWGGGTMDQLIVGIAKDSSNYLAVTIDNKAGTLKIFSVKAGVSTQLNTTLNQTFPNGTRFNVAISAAYPVTSGYSIRVGFLRPGAAYYLAGFHKSTDVNLAQMRILPTFFSFWGVSESAGSTISVTNFTAGLQSCGSAFNQSVVKDITQCAPILAPDGSVYLVRNWGSGNPIIKLNTQTWEFTEVARLFLNDGTHWGLVADSIAYDPNSGNFYVSGSNWGIVGWPDGSEAITPSLGIATTNLLSGINGLAMSRIPFPGSIPAGGDFSTYDFNLLFSGSTWTAFYAQSNQTGRDWTSNSVCLSTAPSVTGPWTQIYKVAGQAATTDGTTISMVGGRRVGLYADENNCWVVTLSSGALIGKLNNATIDPDSGTNQKFTNNINDAPWNGLCPIPGETTGQTRYILPIWNHGNSSGGSYPYQPHANLSQRVFEATQRYTSSEFTWTTK
jgi:hypothetical protein